MTTANDILLAAAETIRQRGAERDQPSGERSMARAVAAFNALTGLRLTEVQGWQFMAALKLARANGGRYNADDYLDGAAYMGLAGEAAAQEAPPPSANESDDADHAALCRYLMRP